MAMGKKIRALHLLDVGQTNKQTRKFKVQQKFFNKFLQQKPMKIETEGGEKRWEEV